MKPMLVSALLYQK